MDREFFVKRAARTIVYQGWDSLFESEINSMRNAEWRAEVMLYVEKYEREKMLEEHGELFSGISHDFSIEWSIDGVHRVAEVWKGENSGKRVLEIKGYDDETFHNASVAGAHELILRRELAADDDAGALDELIEVLESRGCPRDLVLRRLAEAK